MKQQKQNDTNQVEGSKWWLFVSIQCRTYIYSTHISVDVFLQCVRLVVSVHSKDDKRKYPSFLFYMFEQRYLVFVQKLLGCWQLVIRTTELLTLHTLTVTHAHEFLLAICFPPIRIGNRWTHTESEYKWCVYGNSIRTGDNSSSPLFPPLIFDHRRCCRRSTVSQKLIAWIRSAVGIN